MEWFKKHTDMVMILGTFAAAVCWMNARFNQVDRQFVHVEKRFSEVDRQFSEIHEELAVIKTVLIMKNIMPVEMAASQEKK